MFFNYTLLFDNLEPDLYIKKSEYGFLKIIFYSDKIFFFACSKESNLADIFLWVLKFLAFFPINKFLSPSISFGLSLMYIILTSGYFLRIIQTCPSFPFLRCSLPRISLTFRLCTSRNFLIVFSGRFEEIAIFSPLSFSSLKVSLTPLYRDVSHIFPSILLSISSTNLFSWFVLGIAPFNRALDLIMLSPLHPIVLIPMGIIWTKVQDFFSGTKVSVTSKTKILCIFSNSTPPIL